MHTTGHERVEEGRTKEEMASRSHATTTRDVGDAKYRLPICSLLSPIYPRLEGWRCTTDDGKGGDARHRDKANGQGRGGKEGNHARLSLGRW
ncbi:uncharacterized protein SPSK_08191 [Sporothrix schenckii 1099-18]|uniref:Uncharacterized protein n=1 Tax=Sporothrix schenckii 1099-18 TaxID=1397361 RepID=A0A0F2MGU7_SPOSC|nr:uncharacterized protein SPSK_08191 [Sporothrix schenckii 1099-18]KJR88923.1 hypothetical protein SPSK_08191 [Sporothrix schenckii 1099-18]